MGKTYVIGDIHGCYAEFIELMEKIGVKDDDLIISLGDIVDRGNKSLELYHYFSKRTNSIVLMGNHERKHQNGILSYSQEIVKVQFKDEYDGFIHWLDSLPYFYETEEAIIVHAFFEHDKPLQEQKEEVLAGTTSGSRYLEKKYEEGKYWYDFYKGEKAIIYGHHVVGEQPKIINNTYGIDTGACHGGMLTAIELPGFIIHQVKVQKDYWKEAQGKWQVPVLKSKNWEEMKIYQVYQQIEKLGYKEEAEVQEFLKKQLIWIAQIEALMEIIKSKIEILTQELSIKYADNFNKEVAKLSFKTFVFKAKSNKLTLDDLKKTLDTPKKVIDLATELKIDQIPDREN